MSLSSTNEEEEKLISIKFESCSNNESYKKFIGNSNGMFVIESDSMTQGGKVRWNDKYKLRHVITNKYLKLKIPDENSLVDAQKEILTNLTLVQDVENSSDFSFDLIYSTLQSQDRESMKEFVLRDSYFRMQAYLNPRDLQKAKNRGIEEF